jgi:AcrR family transcriptional regulator
VAAHAGVALGTLYRHFRSKDDLLVAALASEAAALAARMARKPPSGPTALERVTAYFAAATRTLCRKPKLARAVLRPTRAGARGKIRAFHGVARPLIRARSDATLAAASTKRVCAVCSRSGSRADRLDERLHKQSEVVAQAQRRGALLP